MVYMKLKRKYQGQAIGDIIKVDDRYAKTLIEGDYAEVIDKNIESPPQDKMVKKPKKAKGIQNGTI